MKIKYEDSISRLHQNLKIIKEKYEALVKSGVDREILEIYLMYKSKLPKKRVIELLKNIDDFFNKLISEETLKKL